MIRNIVWLKYGIIGVHLESVVKQSQMLGDIVQSATASGIPLAHLMNN